MRKASQFLSAVMTLALGILFLVLKTEVIGIAITVLGVALLITALLDLIKLSIITGIIKALLGVAVLVIGWLLIDIAILILGIVLLVYGVVNFFKAVFGKNKGKLWRKIISIIEPILCVIGAIFLITSGGSAIEWAVIVAGVILVIDGILALVGALGSSKK